MLISAFAALVMFAAPEAPQGAAEAPKAAAEAKAEPKKVCTRMMLAGSNLPKRVCTTPKAAPKAQEAEKAAPAPAPGA